MNYVYPPRILISVQSEKLVTTPNSLAQSLTSGAPNSDNIKTAKQDPGWRKAMQDEMDSIWKNKTWTVEPLPPGRRAITYKWVFKLKLGLQGQPPIKKARLIARGFEQRHGIDFEETLAPIIKWATI